MIPRFSLRPKWLVLLLACSSGGLALAASLSTSVLDWQLPGTQPNTIAQLESYQSCAFCHGGFDYDDEPVARWSASMMAQALRDPIFHAALAIGEQDAPSVGDTCLRCHTPTGWLEGRAVATDGSYMADKDYEGVSCNFCHRMVDPDFDALHSPPEDQGILAALALPPSTAANAQGGGQYVVDPEDRRRGPYDLGPGFFWHDWRQSGYHREAGLCGTCHDVSNPAFTRLGGPVPAANDTYVLNATGTPHPSGADKHEQFPLERTLGEWANSSFAQGPIDMGGRFGGDNPLVSTCQDCHMPTTSGTACAPGFEGNFRTDLKQHDFAGANSWVVETILELDQTLALYGSNDVSNLDQAGVDLALQRNVSMLQAASDLELTQRGGQLRARVINQGGHKLPTGYPEGRRMWVNARFFDAMGQLLAEYGAYDPSSATLVTTDTKVYESKLGLDAAVASAMGLPEGPSFHFALVNKVYKDNRIPPRGFTNAGFEAVQAQPVGADYADGQYWDDTLYAIPCGAASAEVRVFHQTTTREYIEFLRDENTTNSKGQLAYNLWLAYGKSAPVEMDLQTIAIGPRLTGTPEQLSLSAGGVQNLCLDLGSAQAGRVYWFCGSISGTAPGLMLDGKLLPLAVDDYFLFTLQSPGAGPLTQPVGLLDAQGGAQTGFVLPAGTSASLAGLTVWHAAAAIDLTYLGVTATSNAAPLLLLP